MRIVMRTQAGAEWTPMDSVAFALEAELQQLLLDSPGLLPMAEDAPGSAPPVVAVGEFGLPGAGLTDIIAFSAEGDITIIECKLATNAEAKRKVIGQVLEYAAFLWQMTYEQVDAQVNQRLGKSLSDAVAGAVSDATWDEETFRQGVAANLAAGSFTLVIAVDGINEELARIIEYVNSRGGGLALSALEMRLFRADGVEILVPHLYGVEAEQSRKASRERRRWTEQEFMEAIRQGLTSDVVATIEDLVAWAGQAADRVWPGTGQKTGSLQFHYLDQGATVSVFSLYTDGSMSINFGYLLVQTARENLERFRDALIRIPTLADLPQDLTKYPYRSIAKVFPAGSDALAQFKAAVEQLGAAIHAAA